MVRYLVIEYKYQVCKKIPFGDILIEIFENDFNDSSQSNNLRSIKS